ncbi:MAG: winged helix DNA-binding domain-containing protein [Deltaproteobacteria bacterium]|nr:winged helix DNA-binding domain-containing protein [Deltaproteobacteria bacterium]
MNDVARTRLAAQAVTRPLPTPAAVVKRLLAVQAQDYPGTVWAVALRCGAGPAEVEAALARREIVRTWPMRGTLHLVAAEDARWMIELMSPRVLASTGKRRAALELDDDTLRRCRSHLDTALIGRTMDREDVFASLESAGIRVGPRRGYHILFHLAQERAIVQVGRDQYALFDEWLPESPSLPRDESLARLARGYLAGHGPATVQDLAWWSGLGIGDCKRGIAAAGDVALPDDPPPAGVHLLPGFDELLLGYRDRTAMLDPEFADRICPGGNGVFRPTLLVDGRMVGTWRAKAATRSVALTYEPFDGTIDPTPLRPAAERYAAFLGKRLTSA